MDSDGLSFHVSFLHPTKAWFLCRDCPLMSILWPWHVVRTSSISTEFVAHMHACPPKVRVWTLYMCPTWFKEKGKCVLFLGETGPQITLSVVCYPFVFVSSLILTNPMGHPPHTSRSSLKFSTWTGFLVQLAMPTSSLKPPEKKLLTNLHIQKLTVDHPTSHFCVDVGHSNLMTNLQSSFFLGLQLRVTSFCLVVGHGKINLITSEVDNEPLAMKTATLLPCDFVGFDWVLNSLSSCGNAFHDVLLLFLCAAQLKFGKQKPRHSKHLENLNKELSLRYYPWNEDWSLWLLLAATFRADSLENSSTARQR